MRRGLVIAALAFALGCRGRDRTPAETPADARAADARPGRALSAADLDRLAGLAVAGYRVAVAARDPDGIALIVEGDGLRATVTAAGCLRCVPPAVAAWEAERPSLVALWGAEPVAGADGVALSIAPLALAGDAAIAVDVRRGEGRPVAYLGHWNDGVRQLQAVCEAPAPAEATAPSPCVALVTAALAAAVTAVR